jgi:hypothetical protein
MPVESITSQSYFRALTILHAALMVGQIMIAGVFYFVKLNEPSVAGVAAPGQFWVYIAGGVTILGVLASTSLFSAKLSQVRGLPTLSQKLTDYRKALILRYTLLEGPALVALLGYFITHNVLLLIFPGLLLLLLLQYRPTREKAIMDLELSTSEQALVNNPDAIVTEMDVSDN